MKTVQLKPAQIKRNWHIFDAQGKVLGPMSVQIAKFLIGKHKVSFTPHVDDGDFVVVINASKVAVTGKKGENKMYYTHSGIPKGFKELTFAQVMAKDPRRVIEHAVKGMLPKNKQQARRMTRLKVFAGNEHIYQDKFKKSEQVEEKN